ncbi:MAG: hypothetical protein ACK4V6_01185 [Microthrixaceae bacterium]|jgi:hypothetical protein
MEQLRRLALQGLVWSARKGFELGDQIHNGWVLANSDHDVRL